MTETKKKQIRNRITAVEAVLAMVLLGYLVYGIVTKNSNQLIFNILAVILVVSSVVLNDVVEPHLTKVFERMDELRKEAYKKYVLWDAASWAGLLLFLFTFGSDDSSFMIVSVLIYVVATRQKREYKEVAFGEVTKADVEAAKTADVEAAKTAVVDTEAVEVEEASEAEDTIEE